MRNRILAIALATVATTAADVASARIAVRVSENGQVAIQRNRKADRVQLPTAVAVGAAVAIASTYGWTAPYVDGFGGYRYGTDW